MDSIMLKTISRTAAATLAATTLVAPGLRAQGREPIVTLKAAAPTAVARSGKGVLTLTFTVRDGYHINAFQPGNPDLIAATLNLKAPAGVTLGKPQLPPSESLTMPGMKAPSRVYAGKKTILVPFTVAKAAKPGAQTIGATLGFQGCSDTACLPPDSTDARATVVVK